MTLNTITLYCTEQDIINVLSNFGTGSRLADVCNQQMVRIQATAGTFALIYGGQTTDALAFNASQFDVQSALRNLIGLENTQVNSRGVTIPPTYHRIRFIDVIGAGTTLTGTNGMTGTLDIAQVNLGTAQPLDDAIVEATEIANGYLGQRYHPQYLALSNLVNRYVTHVAVDIFCSRLGLPVPDSFTKNLERVTLEMEAYFKGWRQLPGIPQKRALGPLWSNIRVVPRYSFRAQRVETSTSSKQQTTQRQDRDWADAFIGPYEYF